MTDATHKKELLKAAHIEKKRQEKQKMKEQQAAERQEKLHRQQ